MKLPFISPKFGFYGGDGVNVDASEFGSECAPSDDDEFLRVAITGNPIVFLGLIYHEIFITSNGQVNFVEGKLLCLIWLLIT